MHCSKAIRQLQLYIDQKLPIEQMRVLEAHLSICSDCRAEYFILEEIDQSLQQMVMIAEPADLTTNVMKRISSSTQVATAPAADLPTSSVFRPSLTEVLTAIVLATVAMLGLILEQLVMRGFISLSDRSPLFVFGLTLWNSLVTFDSQTFMTVLWIFGTVLGVWITLIVAGSDMRNVWFKAVVDRLPVRL